MLKALGAAIILSLAMPVAAQSVYGGGGAECSAWTANLRKRWPHLVDTDWLMGYLSGVNRGRGPGARLMVEADVASATGFVSQFCAANPQRPIFEAADALIAQLEGAPR
ncbi:hypothetical protein [Polymorphobacter fuscus]|uniref:HdeA/HdeB family protein n=1 Tax=Sandarakinorhabdus fusca TaxID=1439888 RepID=A0A7C9KYV2_9SPHN|nr:hypothetical protein [Polymorphobacter fuscus]KAB7643503.1 hypothetical protein F9290_15975 [Polymorphobacter fuscus]MQT18746.1 hypothetical protein [Polymorphobacter fuscus]NJC08706.1 hypothetical protein [Polymorphobacter fuscus]